MYLTIFQTFFKKRGGVSEGYGGVYSVGSERVGVLRRVEVLWRVEVLRRVEAQRVLI